MTALGTASPSPRLATGISVEELDHVVLNVRDLDATLRFYVDVLGMREQSFGDGRIALHFGAQKLNVHVMGDDSELEAAAPQPGSHDLCLRTRTPIEGVLRTLLAEGIDVVRGPVERVGARGPLLSVYVRDPDGNLIELANQLDT